MFAAGYDREEAIQMFDIVDADHGEMWHLCDWCLLQPCLEYLQWSRVVYFVCTCACMLACKNVYQPTGGSVSLEEFIDWFLHNQTGKDKRRIAAI